VAERVGLTQQGLLHYFPTKEALLVAVLAERDQWDAVPRPRRRRHRPLELLSSLVEYNAMRPGIVQTFSALLGESVTEDHPARDFFTRAVRTGARRHGGHPARPSTATGCPAGSPPRAPRRCWSR
jgi:AcrR family transcriptional regulator